MTAGATSPGTGGGAAVVGRTDGRGALKALLTTATLTTEPGLPAYGMVDAVWRATAGTDVVVFLGALIILDKVAVEVVHGADRVGVGDESGATTGRDKLRLCSSRGEAPLPDREVWALEFDKGELVKLVRDDFAVGEVALDTAEVIDKAADTSGGFSVTCEA